MADTKKEEMVPVPDPTKLTTDAVDKAKVELQQLFDTKLGDFRELMIEKFSGRDKALEAAMKAAYELVKQQNDSNTVAFEKAELSTTKQIDAQAERIADLKDRIAELSSRNWAAVGAYIVGGIGVAALVAAALIK